MADKETLAIVDDGMSIDEQVPLTEEQKKRLEEFIEEEEGAHNRYKGVLRHVMTALAVIMSLVHHVQRAGESRDVVTLVRPWRWQIRSEERIQDEENDDERQDPR